MKVLLIRPPFGIEKLYFPKFINEPLGLESLFAFLSPFHDVKIFDAISSGWNKCWEDAAYPDLIFQGAKLKEIEKEIKRYQPDVIGLNWLFSTQNSSVELVTRTIRKIDKAIPIIVGGSHPSTNPIDTLDSNQDINIVVFGEGEETLKELLDNNLSNLESIKGIAYRKNGEIVKNQVRELMTSLDSLPIPDRRSVCYENYSKQFLYKYVYLKIKKIGLSGKLGMFAASTLTSLPLIHKLYYKIYNARNINNRLPAADIYTSRGCPNRCAFCAIHIVWGHSCRFRAAKDVLEEIDILVKKYGIKHINIIDDNFNISKERAIQICQGIVEKKYDLSITAFPFLPTLDEEVLFWFKKAGINYMRISIESGSKHVLHDIIRKNIDLDKVKGIIDICKKLGIGTEGCFMFGIPGEKIEDMRESLDFAERCGFERIVKFVFQPFPNTELYEVCLKNNYLTSDYDPKRMYVTGNKCYVKTNDFSPEDVLAIVNKKF